MRDIRTELEELRRKLQRMEQGQARPATARRIVAGASDVPPWESGGGEAAFEASLGHSGSNQSPGDGGGEAASHTNRSGQPGAVRDISAWIEGHEQRTPVGKHFESETLYPYSHRHGHFSVASMENLPSSLLRALCPESNGHSPGNWVFLDTETIGLAGGAGSFAFLIGLGWLDQEGFRVRQYFLREPAEEVSVLAKLTQDLAAFRTMVTYNGRTFDGPLLETRFRLARMKVPFEEMPHLDLLYSCRRLWKLRFESCKLTSLERDVLGFEREGDVPGFLIPSLYTNFLRTGDAGSLAGVFVHNALDILSLACLTSLVATVFDNPHQASPRHPAESCGLGRWLLRMGRKEEAVQLLWRAASAPIPEDMLAGLLWDIAVTERQRGRYAETRKPLMQLLDFPNRYRNRALEALAVLHERRLRDLPLALHYARLLERSVPCEATAKRVERLVRKGRSATVAGLLES